MDQPGQHDRQKGRDGKERNDRLIGRLALALATKKDREIVKAPDPRIRDEGLRCRCHPMLCLERVHLRACRQMPILDRVALALQQCLGLAAMRAGMARHDHPVQHGLLRGHGVFWHGRLPFDGRSALAAPIGILNIGTSRVAGQSRSCHRRPRVVVLGRRDGLRVARQHPLFRLGQHRQRLIHREPPGLGPAPDAARRGRRPGQRRFGQPTPHRRRQRIIALHGRAWKTPSPQARCTEVRCHGRHGLPGEFRSRNYRSCLKRARRLDRAQAQKLTSHSRLMSRMKPPPRI